MNGARQFLQNELDQQRIAIEVGTVPKDFANDLESELALFKKGVFGWKYLG